MKTIRKNSTKSYARWVTTCLSILTLSACVETVGQPSSGSPSGTPLVSANADFIGKPVSTGVVRLPPMGGISGVTEGAKFPTRFEVAMNATAEAATIRDDSRIEPTMLHTGDKSLSVSGLTHDPIQSMPSIMTS